MPITPLLHGQRVRLTAIKPDDIPIIERWYETGDFARLWDATPAAPKGDAALRQRFLDRDKDPNAFTFAIRLTGTGELIGCAEIDGILWTHQVGWTSIAIGAPDHRGKGYGDEAMRLMLQFAFAELNLHRLQLTVFAYNDRAIRLYEYLGFVREGIYREFLHRDGQRHDMLLYGLLRREWEQNRTG